MLTISTVPCRLSSALSARSSSTAASAPGLASPTALMSPSPQSWMVGSGSPSRGAGPTDLAVSAPSVPCASRAPSLPHGLEARTSGFCSVSGPSLAVRSGSMASMSGRLQPVNDGLMLLGRDAPQRGERVEHLLQREQRVQRVAGAGQQVRAAHLPINDDKQVAHDERHGFELRD